MTRPRVYAPHLPTSRDPDTGEVVPTFDLSPADEHGELVLLLPPSHNPFADPDETVRLLREGLDKAGYRGDRDFLLLVGSPILTSLLAAEAVRRFPFLNLLQWHRREERYLAARYDLRPQSDRAQRNA